MAIRNVGEMRHRITFLQGIGGVDNKGNEITVWNPFKSVWAYREDSRGGEFVAASAIQVEVSATFTIHFRNDINNSMRIRHKEQDFEILNIGGGRNVGDYLYIKAKLIVKEGVAGGRTSQL